MKKIFLIICLCFTSSVLALDYKGCNTSEIARMKALVNNINISYDYTMTDVPVFSVTINNITPDMYFIDTKSRIEYHYENTNNGEITINGYRDGESGKYKFYSAKSECYGVTLGNKFYNTPYYNYYYTDPICDGLDIELCEKWVNINYSKVEFQELIDEYKNNQNSQNDSNIEYEKDIFEKILDFYVKYYIFILLSIILLCTVVIVIRRKKDRFNI